MAEERHKGLALEAGWGGKGGGKGSGKVQEEGTVGRFCRGWECGEREGQGPTARPSDDTGCWTTPCFLLLVLLHLTAHTTSVSCAGSYSAIRTGIPLNLVLGPLLLLCLLPLDNPCPTPAVTTPKRSNCEGLVTAGSSVPTSGPGLCLHLIWCHHQHSTWDSLLLLTA